MRVQIMLHSSTVYVFQRPGSRAADDIGTPRDREVLREGTAPQPLLGQPGTARRSRGAPQGAQEEDKEQGKSLTTR